MKEHMDAHHFPNRERWGGLSDDEVAALLRQDLAGTVETAVSDLLAVQAHGELDVEASAFLRDLQDALPLLENGEQVQDSVLKVQKGLSMRVSIAVSLVMFPSLLLCVYFMAWPHPVVLQAYPLW